MRRVDVVGRFAGPYRRRPGATVVAAVVGASVVFGVHLAQPWVNGTPSDCGIFADCFNDAADRVLVVGGIAVVASLVVLAFTCGRRALLVVPAAFVAQGALMLAVTAVDGYWLPLPLDAFVGACAWTGTVWWLGTGGGPADGPGEDVAPDA